MSHLSPAGEQSLSLSRLSSFRIYNCIRSVFSLLSPTQIRRKSISGNWKANVGSSVLEQVPVTERYKKWLDEVSNLFDGLDMLTVEAVADKDGREIIYEVTGSQMPLMGESQEEDRKLIADLICSKMNSRVNIGYVIAILLLVVVAHNLSCFLFMNETLTHLSQVNLISFALAIDICFFINLSSLSLSLPG